MHVPPLFCIDVAKRGPPSEAGADFRRCWSFRTGKRSSSMELTKLERDFLLSLLVGSWISAPTFDHEIVSRVVELGLVESEPLPSGEIEYRITDAGRAVLG